MLAICGRKRYVGRKARKNVSGCQIDTMTFVEIAENHKTKAIGYSIGINHDKP